MPSPEAYLHGSRGSRVVIVPQRFVNALYRLGLIAELRRQITGADPELDAVAAALVLAALEGNSAPSRVGSNSAPTSEVAGQSRRQATTSPRWLSSRQVADQLNISTRAVVEACRTRRLTASQDNEGRWWIDPDSAATYRAA